MIINAFFLKLQCKWRKLNLLSVLRAFFVQCRRKLSYFDLYLTLVVNEDEGKGFVKVKDVGIVFSSKIVINGVECAPIKVPAYEGKCRQSQLLFNPSSRVCPSLKCLWQRFEVVALSGCHTPLVSSVLPFCWHCWYCQSISWVESEQGWLKLGPCLWYMTWSRKRVHN